MKISVHYGRLVDNESTFCDRENFQTKYCGLKVFGIYYTTMGDIIKYDSKLADHLEVC